MDELRIDKIQPLDKGRFLISFENATEITLYRGEFIKLSLTEGSYISREKYQTILQETVGVRAKKRALHLLEKMDRTQQELYDKLKYNGYPEECITEAIAYVKKYGYIDDLRYAKQYIHYYQAKRSRQRLAMDLIQKGLGKSIIAEALDEEFTADEQKIIKELLERRHFNYKDGDKRELQKAYQFLLRRGFRSSDILKVINSSGVFDEY